MRKELEPIEQAFLLLKNQNERWDEIIREYNERKFDELMAGFHQRYTPNKSLRLTSAKNTSKYHPSMKPHLARKLIDPIGENTSYRDHTNRRLNAGEELPLETLMTNEPLGGRFTFPAHTKALRAEHKNTTPDVPASKKRAPLNLFGFEGTPERYGKNADAEGIIYGDLEPDSVRQLNKKPFMLNDLQTAARMFLPMHPDEGTPSTIGYDDAQRHRARELAQMLMDAEIPGALIDPQTARASGVQSFGDMTITDKNARGGPTIDTHQHVNELTGADETLERMGKLEPLHGTFQQWERPYGPSGRVAELDETHTSPEQMQLLDDQLTAIPGAIMADPTQFYRSEPMDLAMRLLKERVSPEAKRHKLEYDKKYESSPERVKYREDLNRERRRRHIMGQGGPDMSHTSQHTIVPEDPHTNRARHFKDKGTLL